MKAWLWLSGLLGAATFMWLPFDALATWRPEYAQLPDDVRHWFRSQVEPGSGRSCCNEADSVAAEEELRGNHHWTRFVARVKVMVDGAPHEEEYQTNWMEVPEKAILQGANPNGAPVVWWRLMSRTDEGEWRFKIVCYARGNKI